MPSLHFVTLVCVLLGFEIRQAEVPQPIKRSHVLTTPNIVRLHDLFQIFSFKNNLKSQVFFRVIQFYIKKNSQIII